MPDGCPEYSIWASDTILPFFWRNEMNMTCHTHTFCSMSKWKWKLTIRYDLNDHRFLSRFGFMRVTGYWGDLYPTLGVP
jgi:hypothetical protein